MPDLPFPGPDFDPNPRYLTVTLTPTDDGRVIIHCEHRDLWSDTVEEVHGRAGVGWEVAAEILGTDIRQTVDHAQRWAERNPLQAPPEPR